jgi:hypothetical protein
MHSSSEEERIAAFLRTTYPVRVERSLQAVLAKRPFAES